ncbi:helix-turn-helix domain-containing protein [Amycolatopsis acidiphila]|uniref:Helix-turn-helix domain-containing protein n=1 Tax=Amycolatopsis acidiphila TaxID=715473 RepID=A0A557ZZ28_9PSEU|nr:helix-turn-helix domain-containing protein [Amycolatopsis acidiphila]TVT17241.1 helix-turn-helix domain-containing protein [Amycolatopsis acidiphila]UIJ62928.1 helix-turn-helix domain-containing protein [Amycolatopsis acidiphila]
MPRLRLHFTAEDLARTRIVAEPHPMWELVLSLQKVRSVRPHARYAEWREHSLPRLGEPAHRRHLDLLTTLVPPRGNFPDFLTPAGGEGEFGDVLETVLSTPRQRLRREMAAILRGRQASPAAGLLADGSADGLRELADAASWYHDTVLRPHWSAVRRAFGADRGSRVHDLSGGGVERLLSRLPGCTRWEAPVLECPYPVNRNLELGGRGLSLIPSYFCQTSPVTLIDPALPPVLVYPAGDLPVPGGGTAALVALLGDTRAQVLRALRVPRSTTSIAGYVRTSAASASKHAAVLREAGLVTSTRDGHAVLHAVTPLGLALLDVVGGA